MTDRRPEWPLPTIAKTAVPRPRTALRSTNTEARETAENYLDMTAFSRDGLVQQLTFEGYSQAQAEYGVGKVGL